MSEKNEENKDDVYFPIDVHQINAILHNCNRQQAKAYSLGLTTQSIKYYRGLVLDGILE
jgi:hypothetical protein